MIPYGRQSISQQDIDAVVQVLKSDFLTQGPAIPRFEQELATYCDAKNALAFNSATSALHSACHALGLGPGGLLWTSPNSFVASSNCALYCGADVDFVDIEPETGNMSVDVLRQKLEEGEKTDKLPDIVVPVHFAGQPCDMQEIKALSETYGFRIIEDAAHAIGATYHGGHIGNCEYSDITVFSFHPVKIITTGEGGAALTNDEYLHQRMMDFRSHGITKDEQRFTNDPDGPWYYEQQELGFNYRMTDIQAALGSSQLEKLNQNLARRTEIREWYDSSITDLPVTHLQIASGRTSANHLYVIQTANPKDRLLLFQALRASDIGVNVHYIPIYRQPYYKRLGFRQGLCPNAEEYYSRAISLPMFPTISEKELLQVVNAIKANVE